MKPTAKFTLSDAEKAYTEWHANCGPGAIAGVLGLTLEEVRPHLGDFEKKHYTNPKLMFEILERMGVNYTVMNHSLWPFNGLVRVQWEGPWTEAGVPRQKRYRHSHWVASKWDKGEIYIFDINCIKFGGWVPVLEWKQMVVPWLLQQVEPEAYGTWHPTHKLEIVPQEGWKKVEP